MLHCASSSQSKKTRRQEIGHVLTFDRWCLWPLRAAGVLPTKRTHPLQHPTLNLECPVTLTLGNDIMRDLKRRQATRIGPRATGQATRRKSTLSLGHLVSLGWPSRNLIRALMTNDALRVLNLCLSFYSSCSSMRMSLFSASASAPLGPRRTEGTTRCT